MDDNPPEATPDADRLIARAIESVLGAVPELPGGDLTPPETSPKVQPWAETAAPPGGNKRSLEELVAEYAARVAADPDAVAGRPKEVHPAAAYLERLTPGGGQAAPRRGGGGKRRWRGGRRRRGGRKGGGGSPA